MKRLILLAIFGLTVAACAGGVSSSRLAGPQANLADVPRAETRVQAKAEATAEAEAEVAVAAQAEAAAEAEGQAQASEQSADDDEGVICRKEAVTGTYRRVRVCTTREQREASRQAAQDLLHDVTRKQPYIGSEGQGG